MNDSTTLARPALRLLRHPLRTTWRAIRIAALKWNIAATEDYVAACAVDGILDSDTLRQWRLYIASDRVALALLEQQP